MAAPLSNHGMLFSGAQKCSAPRKHSQSTKMAQKMKTASNNRGDSMASPVMKGSPRGLIRGPRTLEPVWWERESHAPRTASSASRGRRSKTWRSTSFLQIHQKYIYVWNNSYRTPTECWQKTSDFLKGSWCSGRVSGLSLWCGRAKFRTLVHQRPPSST